MSRCFLPVPGRWVELEELDDTGEKIPGFYITEERAATFSQEPGFRKHRLFPVFVELPEPPPFQRSV